LLGGDTNVNGGIYNTPDEDLQSKTEMTDGNKALIEAALAEEPVSEEHAALQEKVKEEYEAYLASGETGIFDSADWFALQTWNGGDKVADLTLVENMADNAYDGLEWLESLGATFKDEISQGPGSLYPRTHDTETGLGAEFINTYSSYLTSNYGDNWKVYYNVAADELEVDDSGAVYAVHGTDSYGNEYTFTAENGIVLATGGFAGNVEMRVKYCQGDKWPDLGENVGCTGVESDTGDGIVMAEAIGANLVDMDQIQLLHMCSPTKGTTDDNSAKDKGVSQIIFVNQEGNRFTAEDGRRDDICKAVLEQTNGIFYAIESWDGNGDATLDELVTNNGVSYSDEIAQGNMYIADTLEELAEQIGADPDNLVAAVAAYNQSVDEGATEDEFGRKTFTDKLETGPFIAVPRKPSAHHTMGGVQINTNTEVLDTDGNVISGLYAAGEVTGGIHGGNRLGGNAIVDTVVNGKIAGEQAAGYSRS
ncbi:MAG: flavocytochrome c, partial [Bulleidia sp.]